MKIRCNALQVLLVGSICWHKHCVRTVLVGYGSPEQVGTGLAIHTVHLVSQVVGNKHHAIDIGLIAIFIHRSFYAFRHIQLAVLKFSHILSKHGSFIDPIEYLVVCKVIIRSLASQHVQSAVTGCHIGQAHRYAVENWLSLLISFHPIRLLVEGTNPLPHAGSGTIIVVGNVILDKTLEQKFIRHMIQGIEVKRAVGWCPDGEVPGVLQFLVIPHPLCQLHKLAQVALLFHVLPESLACRLVYE